MLLKNGWITLRKKKKSDTMKYPTINFTGNKRKLVDWIYENMPIKNGTILDIFSGGCSVSYMFKSNGFKVISNDCLYANYVIAKAIIENNSVHIDKSVLNMDITQEELETELNNIKFLSNKLYFDYELPELAKLISISKKLTGYEKYLFLALLRKAMIRKLPYSRMNIKWDKIVQLRNEEYSYKLYGRRRAYHNESFTKHILEGIDEYNNAIFDNGLKCVATNMDVMEIANKIVHVDAVYLDPPYPGTTNDYESFYGPFGTMFGLNQNILTDFTSKDTFLEKFEKLIEVLSTKTDYFIISLNTATNPPPSAMIDMLSKYGSITSFETNHNYQLTGKTNKTSSKELLIIVKLNKNSIKND